MSVTATRLGSSPITLDWTGFARIPAGGSTPNFKPIPYRSEDFESAWRALKSRFVSREVGFYDAPTEDFLSEAQACEKLAAEIRSQGWMTDVLFLGIGGSALGPISLLQALGATPQGPRFHFVENPDPTAWNQTIQHLRPESTLVCVVTKSGTTFETLAQALCALEWTGRNRWKSHVVAMTDPEKGDLRKWARNQGVPCLTIHPSIGGRFSIFSPVGLFPLALAGFQVAPFLEGAKQVRDYCEKTALEKNPLFLLGADLIRHFPKRPIHVCMPYSTSLRSTADWFVQLWAESLGKDGKGFTPIGALGATDQHSILQLLRDGPDDKVTWFLTVDQVADPVKIPKVLSGLELNEYPSFAQLQEHSFQDLLRMEYQATSKVLAQRSRPQFTMQLDRIDERAMGALYFAFSVMTAFTGTYWGVNPFDQPGVEEAKVYIREALKRRNSDETSYSHTGEEDDTNSPVARLRLHREREQDRRDEN
jgi:glucose-6-phosphate isomerase